MFYVVVRSIVCFSVSENRVEQLYRYFLSEKRRFEEEKITLAGQMANSFHARLMIYLSLGKTKRMIKVQSRKLLPGEKVPLSKLKASVYRQIILYCRYDQK